MRRGIAALFVALALVLAACGGGGDGEATAEGSDGAGTGGSETTGTVTVGLINPTTGPFAALGEDTNDGFRYYVDRQGGQLAGYDVEILAEDTGNDTAVATEAARRLIEREGADVLAGFVNSGVAYGATTYIAETGAPLIITTAGADGLTQGDAVETIFRVSYTSSQDAMPLGDYACNELGLETMVVVGLDYAFGWEAAGGFARAYEDAGCDVVQEVYGPLGTQDWAPFVQQIETGADGVWAVLAGPDAVRFVQAYRDFGVELPLNGHGALTDEQVLVEQQDAADGVTTTLHYTSVLDTPLNQEFVAGFEEEYGRSVSQYAEHGYAAAQVIEAALEEGGPDALSESIPAVEITAPRGPLRFDEYGQAVYNVYVRRVEQVEQGWGNVVQETYEDVSQFWEYEPEEYLEFPPYEELKGTWAQ